MAVQWLLASQENPRADIICNYGAQHSDIRWWIIHDLAATMTRECALSNLRIASLVCHHSHTRPVAYH